jgi:hypothetical protein
VLTDIGPVEIDVPRDREGSCEPAIIKKRQRRLTGVGGVWSRTVVQICVVHLLRASFRYAARQEPPVGDLDCGGCSESGALGGGAVAREPLAVRAGDDPVPVAVQEEDRCELCGGALHE